MHRNSVPVSITTSHMQQDRPYLLTATPGNKIVCIHGCNVEYLHCACLTCFLFYSVCENRKWRCTEKVCDGTCRTVGEGHYITFDGLKYSFPGLCQYVLVQVRHGDPKQFQRILWCQSIKIKCTFLSLSLYLFATFPQDMCNGEEGSFRVLVENEACGIVGHRCAKAIMVFYMGGLIVMQHGEVTYINPFISTLTPIHIINNI